MDNKDQKIQTVKLNREIASFYQHLFTIIPKAQHIILHSGRACTKSTFISMWDLWRLIQLPHSDIIVMANEFSSIKDKVFGDYKFAAKLLKIPEPHIEYHCSDKECWIKVRNKWGENFIKFEHAKYGAESLKGMHPSIGNSWINVRFYELTNFESWNSAELTKAIATFIRDAQGTIKWNAVKKFCKEEGYFEPTSKEELYDCPWFYKNWEYFLDSLFCITYEFNTPGARSSWVMDWLEIQKRSKDTYYQFNNYLDLSESEQFRFLGPQMLKEIDNVKHDNPVNYNHEYLGKQAYDGDIVWPLLNKDIHFGKHENFQPDILVIGIDVGRSDATVCILNGFEYDHKDLRIQLGMHRWYHCNRKAEFVKDGIKHVYRAYDMFDYCNMIIEFYEMVHKEYPFSYIYFQMDYANEGKSFYDTIFRGAYPLYLNVNKSWEKVSIPQRVDTLSTALSCNGIVKINDYYLFQAIKNQLYAKQHDQSGERKLLDDPTKPSLDMDTLDATFYGILKGMYPQIRNRIRNNRGKWE